MVLSAVAAQAQGPFILTDVNSTAVIDTSTNMTSWTVDGANQLYEQDWWIRVGDNRPLRVGDWATTVDWVQPTNSILVGTFSNGGVSVVATYMLGGGVWGSRTADIGELLNVTTGGQAVTVYEYVDFDLGISDNDDYAVHANASTIRQWDADWVLQESVVPTPPTAWEIGPYATILNKLQGPGPYGLSNNTSPFGPGDVTYAWQWDTGGATSFLISKNKHLSSVIPEPMSFLLGALGLGTVASFRRLRKK